MKKIALISFLMFFVHFFILIVLFTRLNAYIPKHYESNDRGIFTLIAFYLTFLLYALSVILVIVEKLMRVKYKWGIYFLLYLNCLSVFYINAFINIIYLIIPNVLKHLQLLLFLFIYYLN